jgi:anti-sigma-K factor RskA
MCTVHTHTQSIVDECVNAGAARVAALCHAQFNAEAQCTQPQVAIVAAAKSGTRSLQCYASVHRPLNILMCPMQRLQAQLTYVHSRLIALVLA